MIALTANKRTFPVVDKTEQQHERSALPALIPSMPNIIAKNKVKEKYFEKEVKI